jgi:hypothetical protein
MFTRGSDATFNIIRKFIETVAGYSGDVENKTCVYVPRLIICSTNPAKRETYHAIQA